MKVLAAILAIALCLAGITHPLAAAEPAKPAAPPTPWTAEDLLSAESLAAFTISPDGRWVAWGKTTVATVEGAERRVTHLWLSRWPEGTAQGSLASQVAGPVESWQLTRGNDSVSAPTFSPDGKLLAFVTSRKAPGGKGEKKEDSGPQLWVLPVDHPGEAWPATRLDRGVRSFGWIDGETLVFAAPEAKTAWELEREEAEEEAFVVDDEAHEPPVRLYRVAARGGEVKRLTTNADWVSGLEVSPDGQRAVVVAQRSLRYQFNGQIPPVTRLVDLTTGSETPILTDGVVLPQGITWQPDSKGFFVINAFSRHPLRQATVNQLYHVAAATGVAQRIELGWERGLSDNGGLAVTSDGGFLALLADGVHDRLARFSPRAGAPGAFVRREVAGEHQGVIERFELTRDGGKIAYLASRATQLPQLYTARLEAGSTSAVRALTTLNAGLANKPTGRVDVITWKGAEGATIEGLLHYPLDWVPGTGKRPLILDIHGGPAARDRNSWDENWGSPKVLLRQKGAFVLQVNYHGSTGYGLDFVESIGNGRYYELEIPDIEAGVDHVIGLGLVDPERLATSGWSNGGILSAELITRTPRYKAASIGAADVEWFSDWGNVDFGDAFDSYYFGGRPWEKVDVYLAKSPFFRLTAVTTPTIIYTGTEDTNVPPHQSWSLYRALREIGKTEARLVIFPGEPHGLQQQKNRRRKLEEDLAWWDRHLFGTSKARNEAIRKGSPLEGLLARGAAAQAPDGRYGVLVGGSLVPETVRFAGLEVGRFEVTRAQLAAASGGAGAGDGANWPATGVSLAQAQSYVTWLAAQTGRPFRLPTVAEAEHLASAAGEGGNTLERWAGYTPAPDAAAQITQALAARFPGQPALLLTVGSLPGDGEDPVFDLDGNAAEWAVGAEGQGKPVGPSADRADDPHGDEPPAEPLYVGFRVVVGAPG